MAPESNEAVELASAESECERLIREVEKYDWDCGPYPLAIAFPYPEQDIYFFHTRAADAEHLKVKLLAIFERLGPQAEGWKEQIKQINFAEMYIFEGLTPGAKRPFAS